MSTLKYRSDIDGLRALAVLSVVLYHVSPQSLPGGFLGVDIFFVSLIVFREQAAGTFSFADLYVRRARRLFPALAVVLLATIVFGAFTLFADEYQRLPAQNCVLRPLTVTENKTGCSVDRAVYQERMRTYRALVANLHLNSELFRVVDPGPVFCDSSMCRGVSDGQLLYADDNHLSVLGSTKLSPIILQALFAAKPAGTTR